MSHECPGAVGQGNIWDTRFGALPLPCPTPHQATLKDSNLVGTVSKFSFHKAHVCVQNPKLLQPAALPSTLRPPQDGLCLGRTLRSTWHTVLLSLLRCEVAFLGFR